MRSADVVASCSGHAASCRPAARRRFFCGAAFAFAALWGFALMPRGNAVSPKDAANQDAPAPATLSSFPLGEPIAIAVTPEWEPLVRRIGQELTAEHPKIRFYVVTAPADAAFEEMARGKVLGVVAPRLMTSSELLRMAACNYSIVQASLMLDRRHLDRLPPDANAAPPAEGDFLFLYLRGEALNSRPGLQAFRRRFLPKLVTPAEPGASRVARADSIPTAEPVR
jgi:hypothetical protein